MTPARKKITTDFYKSNKKPEVSISDFLKFAKRKGIIISNNSARGTFHEFCTIGVMEISSQSETNKKGRPSHLFRFTQSAKTIFK